jgi:hypothetical protein
MFEKVGSLNVNGYDFVFGNDGIIYVQDQPVGKYYFDNTTGNITLLDNNDSIWAIASAGEGANNIVLTDPNSGTIYNANWTANVDFSGDFDADIGIPQGEQESYIGYGGPALVEPASPATPAYLGSIEFGGVTYHVTDDGSGTYILRGENNTFATATINPNTGLVDISAGGVPLYTLDLNTGVVMNIADGSYYGQATFQPSSAYDQPELPDNYIAELTLTAPDGNTITGYMTSDGRIVDSENNTLLTYSRTGNNTYDLFNLDGSPWGDYNSQTGIYNTVNGESGTLAYNPLVADIPPYGDTTTTATASEQTASTSGIDWDSPVARDLLGSIVSSAQELPGLAETAGTQAQDYYTNLMKRAMGPQNFQGYLNALSGRGVLGSSMTENTMATAATDAARAVADKAFEASLANTQKRMEVPGILSGLVGNLGGSRTTSSGGRQATTTVTNPYAPLDYYLRIGGF